MAWFAGLIIGITGFAAVLYLGTLNEIELSMVIFRGLLVFLALFLAGGLFFGKVGMQIVKDASEELIQEKKGTEPTQEKPAATTGEEEGPK